MVKSKRTLVVLALIGTVVISSSVALSYNTDSGSVTNSFTTAKLKTALLEDEWDKLPDSNGDNMPDASTNIVQGKVVNKDPVVSNKSGESTVDCYCFLSVKVPVRSVMTVSSAPSKSKTELFSYAADPSWVLLNREDASDSYTCMYGYNKAIKPGEKTIPLFTTVKYAEVVEGEIPTDETLHIDVNSYTIQEPGFTDMHDAYNSFDWEQEAMEKE